MSFVLLGSIYASIEAGMMRRGTRAILTMAMLVLGFTSATAHAEWIEIEPDSWATYEQRYYWNPPDPPYSTTSFRSGWGGGTRREISFNGDTRYDPTAPTWNIRAGATFSLAALTPGDSEQLSLTAVSAMGLFDDPDVSIRFFGANGPLVESDFQNRHDPEDYAYFTLPQIYSWSPPVTRSVEIGSFIEEIRGRYTHLGVIFASSGGNMGNEVVFDVKLGFNSYPQVPEPSSVVMGASALLAGLAAARHRARRAARAR